MNLHDVIRINGAIGLFRHTVPAWARVVRASTGQAHIYDMPGYGNNITCYVYAQMFGGVIPRPLCGKEPRETRYPFRQMTADNAGAKPWTNYCADCAALEAGVANAGHNLRYQGYWNSISTEEQLERFYASLGI